MLGKIYPVGYGNPGTTAYLDSLMDNDETMYLIDTRYSPRSRRPEWRGGALQAKYPQRYRWFGASIGNVNYSIKSAPIKLADPEPGIAMIIDGLRKGHSAILLCQCRDYHSCHRKVIVELLQYKLPEVSVVFPSRCHCCDIIVNDECSEVVSDDNNSYRLCNECRK